MSRFLVTLVALAFPLAPSRPDRVVLVRTFQFAPDSVVVAAGARIEWRNDDEIGHTVTAGLPGEPGRTFGAALAARGARYEARFTEPGVFRYHCARHPFMRGAITVLPQEISR